MNNCVMPVEVGNIISLIDNENAKDPNLVNYNGEMYPKELLYSKRMTEVLFNTISDPSEELQVAIRAQHICRWSIKRTEYTMDRLGYFQWRNDLKKMHSEVVSSILSKEGYSEEFIKRVAFLIRKKNIKKDRETQILEDTACLVFLQYYMEDFILKHTDEKIIDIVQKTWKKMSSTGHENALKLEYSSRSKVLIKRALERKES